MSKRLKGPDIDVAITREWIAALKMREGDGEWVGEQKGSRGMFKAGSKLDRKHRATSTTADTNKFLKTERE
jgi:hypothetical protein